jgi:hypothetical protein
VGRRLIDRVVAEAVTRGYEYLAIRPVARNVDAIHRFFDVGFRTLWDTWISRWIWPGGATAGWTARTFTGWTSGTELTEPAITGGQKGKVPASVCPFLLLSCWR